MPGNQTQDSSSSIAGPATSGVFSKSSLEDKPEDISPVSHRAIDSVIEEINKLRVQKRAKENRDQLEDPKTIATFLTVIDRAKQLVDAAKLKDSGEPVVKFSEDSQALLDRADRALQSAENDVVMSLAQYNIIHYFRDIIIANVKDFYAVACKLDDPQKVVTYKNYVYYCRSITADVDGALKQEKIITRMRPGMGKLAHMCHFLTLELLPLFGLIGPIKSRVEEVFGEPNHIITMEDLQKGLVYRPLFVSFEGNYYKLDLNTKFADGKVGLSKAASDDNSIAMQADPSTLTVPMPKMGDHPTESNTSAYTQIVGYLSQEFSISNRKKTANASLLKVLQEYTRLTSLPLDAISVGFMDSFKRVKREIDSIVKASAGQAFGVAYQETIVAHDLGNEAKEILDQVAHKDMARKGELEIEKNKAEARAAEAEAKAAEAESARSQLETSIMEFVGQYDPNCSIAGGDVSALLMNTSTRINQTLASKTMASNEPSRLSEIERITGKQISSHAYSALEVAVTSLNKLSPDTDDLSYMTTYIDLIRQAIIGTLNAALVNYGSGSETSLSTVYGHEGKATNTSRSKSDENTPKLIAASLLVLLLPEQPNMQSLGSQAVTKLNEVDPDSVDMVAKSKMSSVKTYMKRLKGIPHLRLNQELLKIDQILTILSLLLAQSCAPKDEEGHKTTKRLLEKLNKEFMPTVAQTASSLAP